MDKNGLLEIITAHRINDDLDEVLKTDKDYQEALAEQKKIFARLEGLELTAEQKRVVDLAITANNQCGAAYGSAAYRFGMEDGIRLRTELEEIIRFPQ